MIQFIVCDDCGRAMDPEKAFLKSADVTYLTTMTPNERRSFYKNAAFCQRCFSIRFKDNVDEKMREFVIHVDEATAKRNRPASRRKTRASTARTNTRANNTANNRNNNKATESQTGTPIKQGTG